jgi:uncharacterized MAPEG superfamily protein
MTIALWCLVPAILLPYVFTVIAKVATVRQLAAEDSTDLRGAGRRYNNRDPRAFLERAEGVAKRAHNTQLNTFEALPGFVAGILVATHLGADQGTLDVLAVSWLVLRVVYGLCYIKNLASLRSLVWMASLGVVLALFAISLGPTDLSAEAGQAPLEVLIEGAGTKQVNGLYHRKGDCNGRFNYEHSDGSGLRVWFVNARLFGPDQDMWFIGPGKPWAHYHVVSDGVGPPAGRWVPSEHGSTPSPKLSYPQVVAAVDSEIGGPGLPAKASVPTSPSNRP